THRASSQCVSAGGRLADTADCSEALPTFLILKGPFIGPFPTVDHLVTDQIGALNEALPTFSTLIGQFPSVSLLVADQTGPPAEALLTF
ncbi:hypothetical protein Nmel_005276, partial [Mimus melanotis]